MSETTDWRPIFAALANPDARLIYARIVVGQPADRILDGVNAAKARRALDALSSAGLVTPGENGARANDGVFLAGLAAQPARPEKSGVDRFFDDDGRIDRYPSNRVELLKVLTVLAAHVLASGEVVDEAEITARLSRYTDDPALLRRHLIDHGVLERTRSGSEYGRVIPPD